MTSLEVVVNKLTTRVVNNTHIRCRMKLLRAAEQGDLEKVKLLANQGINVGVFARNTIKVLHWIVFGGDNVNALQYTSNPKMNIIGRDSKGRTPLHFAAHNNNVDLVKFLLEHEANTDVSDNDGHTPLHMAVKNHRYDNIELLLKHGANINSSGKPGGMKWTPLHSAITCDAEMMKFLLRKGANSNAKDWVSRTPLHWAVDSGYSEKVEILLKSGANIKVKDKDGATALSLVKNGNMNIKMLLKRYGAIE